MNLTFESTKKITNYNSKIKFKAKLSYGSSGQKNLFCSDKEIRFKNR